ncbi:MAG: CDP-glucose 4,6-dehydratase [Bacillus sp. (in: Bacteria)]|nr:CDP-glucose 4,6-dehydratase [Bacillus sp. (in: firmicutes)]MCM1426135.1 CDP-glucose 4,6-dehydratase [Eubacterium sp.]
MLDFYKGKRVLVTGHTGFKGAWMCRALTLAGAEVTGYALNPPTAPNLFDMLSLQEHMDAVSGDIRDLDKLRQVFTEAEPEIVIHMAAQPIVRESYKNPVYTYDVNVMGTVNVLECVRLTKSVKSFVNVTTDKVYKNREWEWGYRENEELNGYDPYSNSKSCSELVTDSYKNSFFQDRNIAISTMRAGNVIGGGDFAADRIIPDCVRAAVSEKDIIIRNPYSIRPFQHVLEPVMAYLILAKAQYGKRELAGCYNIGPDEADCVTTGELAEMFCDIWQRRTGTSIRWISMYDGGPHEANYLKLDCSKFKNCLGWRPLWSIDTALDKTIELYRAYYSDGDVRACIDEQIKEYCTQFLMAVK